MRAKKVALACLVLTPFLLGATLPDDTSDRYTRLSLNGVGFAAQATDFQAVTASTTTFSTSASHAVTENAATMKALRGRLRQFGVLEADFRTGSFQFGKGSDPDDDDGDRANGYVVRHQMQIVVRDADRTGAIMDALVSAGATDLSIAHGRGYSADVSPESLRKARGEAVRDAMAKAQDYAGALGMKVHRIVSVQDGSGYVTDRPMPVARLDVTAAPTQIDNRDATVQASVGVVFELEK